MNLNLSADEVLTTTRSVRKRLDFDRPVEDEVLRECLELALQAPSGSNAQSWRFVVVTDPDKPAKTVAIRLTYPNSCSLKYDEVGIKLREMLEASGIEPKEPAEAEQAEEASEA